MRRRELLDRCHTGNFIARFCRATLGLSRDKMCDMACRTISQQSRNSFSDEQRFILCNFVAKRRLTLIGQFLFRRQSCSVRHGMSHLRCCLAIRLRWHNRRCSIGLTNEKTDDDDDRRQRANQYTGLLFTMCSLDGPPGE